MRIRWFGKTISQKCEYASKEEFASIFECERVGLQRLALSLTANRDAAKRCLILAFPQCVACGSVSQGWVLSWARRMVIRSAISLVMGCRGHLFVNTNDDSDSGLIAFSPDDSLSTLAEAESILDLPDFDRLVFVISVLEGYSMHDCALLLGRSPRDISEARQRVVNQVGRITDRSNSCHELERPVRNGGTNEHHFPQS